MNVTRPLTTAALSNIPRHELAGAAGVNSFIRQVGGSIGLSIFATLFTRYGVQGAAGLTPGVTALRPEVASQVSAMTHALLARGYNLDTATAIAQRWGFPHYGRFAAQYRRAYGCAPADTLRSMSR